MTIDSPPVRPHFALALVALASCSSPVTPAPPQETNTRPVPTLTDEDRVAAADCTSSWIAAATGRVVDNTGAPIEGASVGYCVFGNGLGNCLAYVKTTKNGWYNYPISKNYRCVDKAAVHALAPAATNQRLSESYCTPTLTPNRGVLDNATDEVLYRLAAPTSIPPLGDIKQSRTVTFPGDIEVTLTPDAITESDQYERLSAAPIDPAARPCFVPKDLTLDGLVAFSPNMNVAVFSDNPVKIGAKLPTTLPEGTAVDLYLLGGVGTQLDTEHAVEEGTLAKFGTGKVTGGRVVPDSGSELTALTVVGYKRR